MALDLWAPRGEEQFRDDMRRIKLDQRQLLESEFSLSVDYLANKQVEDVEGELLARFPKAQDGTSGQEIQALTLPITERYVSEAATLYNRSVKRWFSEDDGTETDTTKKQTEKLKRMLDRARHDEIMHASEKLVVLNKTNCVWPQLHKGQYRPVVAHAHLVYPVAPPPEEAFQVDPADPDDYAGFVVQSEYDKEDLTSAQSRVFSYVTPAQTIVFQGVGPREPQKILASVPNPIAWAQNGKMRPGNLLTFWHETAPTDTLIPACDATVARANRELNIQWSLLCDTLRFQSYATPVMHTEDKRNPKANMVHGARFPAVVGIEEKFEYANASNPYAEIVGVLDHLGKLLMVLLRQNPEDFSITGSKAVSGFARQVASLPKLEAREERSRRALHMERFVMAQRIVAIGIFTGELDPVAAAMKYNVQFPSIEPMRTIDEDAKRLEYRVNYGMTTPAEELAQERGITVEQAEAVIMANLEKTKEIRVAMAQQNQAQPGQQQPGGDHQGGREARDKAGDIFSRLIGGGARARRAKEKAAEEAEQT